MYTNLDANYKSRLRDSFAEPLRSRAWFVLVLLLLAGCIPNQQIRDRFDYWSDESNQYFSEPRTLQETHSWLRSHNVIYTFDDSDIVNNGWSTTLEKIYFDGWWCDWVDLKIDIAVDESRQVLSHELSIKRACWWWY